MKKSVKIRVFSLVIAAVLLGGALTVAAVMGSPYETLKKALLNATTYRNVTVENWANIAINGETYETQKTSSVNGDGATLSYYFENGEPSYSYYSGSLNIYRSYVGEDQTQWYSAYVQSPTINSYSNTLPYRIGWVPALTPEDLGSAQMRFAELAVDALVGDLKNNFIMDSTNGIRKISATLTEAQIPELAKAGLDVLVEQSGNWYYDWKNVLVDGEYVQEQITIKNGTKTVRAYKQAVRPMTAEEQVNWDNGELYVWGDDYYDVVWIDGIWYIAQSPQELAETYTAPVTREDFDKTDDPLSIPMQSLTINYLHGEAEVDSDGNLLSIDFEAKATIVNVLGDINVVEFNGGMNFSEIGTSEAVCPIPGAEQLLTSDYMQANFGCYFGTVYFKLNADGSINAASVTTTYPGEFEKNNYLNNYMY